MRIALGLLFIGTCLVLQSCADSNSLNDFMRKLKERNQDAAQRAQDVKKTLVVAVKRLLEKVEEEGLEEKDEKAVKKVASDDEKDNKEALALIKQIQDKKVLDEVKADHRSDEVRKLLDGLKNVDVDSAQDDSDTAVRAFALHLLKRLESKKELPPLPGTK